MRIHAYNVCTSEKKRQDFVFSLYFIPETKYKRRVIPRAKLVKLYVRRVDHTQNDDAIRKPALRDTRGNTMDRSV